MNEIDQEEEMRRLSKDRRQPRTPYDWVSGLGGGSATIIGVFIYQMVSGLSAQIDDHGDMIRENRATNKAVLEELDDIKKEFSLDIQDFKLKHRALTAQLDACERQQMAMMGKMDDFEDIEHALEQWRGLEKRLKDWAESTFQKRK